MSLHVTGKSGQLRVGGRVAASLGDWTLDAEPPKEEWALTGRVTGRDDMLLESGVPIELRLQLTNDTWRWRNVQVDGYDVVTVRGTGEPEVIHSSAVPATI